MRKPLALFEIDKTMFNGLSFYPLMDAQLDEGLLDNSSRVQAQAALEQYKEQTLDYESFIKRLLNIYAEGLMGNTADEVQESTNKFFNQTPDFFGYVKPTIDFLSSTHEITLVTGSSHFTAKAVAKIFGVANYISTQLDADNGTLNGKVKSYLATRHEKRAAIHHLTDAHPRSGSFGFGDSEGDIEMLKAVEHPICIRPTPGLAELAQEQGWHIVQSDDDLKSPHCLEVVRLAVKQ